MASVHEQLSEQFYKWEIRGRGVQVFPDPVYPEPPFIPFLGHHVPNVPIIDDGLKPTFLSSLFRKISKREAPPEIPPEEEEEPEPETLIRDPLVELQTILPADLDIARDAFAHFLSNLSRCQEPIAFELLGVKDRITVQFASHEDDAPLVRRQLIAHFPETVFQVKQGTLADAWEGIEAEDIFIIEFGLAHEFMLPLATGKLDPFVGIIGALSELQENELGLFQILFQPLQNPWSESIVSSVTHADGKPFFVNMPELASAAEAKTSERLYAVVVRIALKTLSNDRTLNLARDLAGALSVFAHPRGNELIPLQNDKYPFEEHIEDTLRRQTRRSGMILSISELIGFVHLPGSAVRSSALLRDTGVTKAAPEIVRRKAGLLLGDNIHAGETVPVRITPEHRVHHCHIIGASGTGKSTLLFNLIRQDIENGDGVAVLDPHGDLIDRILGIIPESRIDDVVLVDPSDPDFPIGFNILSAHSDQEKALLASDLVSVFRRLSASWGDQMDTVLQNTILAFLESSRGGTLPDLRRFLIEPQFRSDFLKTVTDPELIYYWTRVFPQLTGNRSVGPVLTRLQGFLSQKPIRNMVSQPENKLDFARIMDTGKIFLAKLSEGLLGAENSYMLGTLLVSKFQQIAMSRQAQVAASRRDYWLYIDEFDQFITPTMAEILKGARKYRLGLTLAHQELHQLQSDPKVASAVATHPFTRIVFRVSDTDAKRLAEMFTSFDSTSLKNLETFQAIARVERSDCDFNLTVRPPVKLDRAMTESRRDQVITASREKYGRPRAEVEAEFLSSLGMDTFRPDPQPANPAKPRAPIITPAPPVPVQESKVVPPAPPPEIKDATAEIDSDSKNEEHGDTKILIRVEAETLGYTVEVEERVPEGGRIDVVLRRGQRKIACEISVTNTVKYETDNVAKCLRAGFSEVAMLCRNPKKLTKIKEAVAEQGVLKPACTINFYSPEEFLSCLFEWASSDPAGGEIERAKPRKQDIDLGSSKMSESERQGRERSMLADLAATMKENKKQKPKEE